jgi:hypothetical protein
LFNDAADRPIVVECSILRITVDDLADAVVKPAVSDSQETTELDDGHRRIWLV